MEMELSDAKQSGLIGRQGTSQWQMRSRVIYPGAFLVSRICDLKTECWAGSSLNPGKHVLTYFPDKRWLQFSNAVKICSKEHKK